MSWYEHLPKEDIPPEHIWEDPQGLEQWWNEVEARREDGGSTKRGKQIESAGEDGEHDLVQNDLAAAFKR